MDVALKNPDHKSITQGYIFHISYNLNISAELLTYVYLNMFVKYNFPVCATGYDSANYCMHGDILPSSGQTLNYIL